jgi:predicted membrane-bound mannosyltransferase
VGPWRITVTILPFAVLACVVLACVVLACVALAATLHAIRRTPAHGQEA